MAKTTKPVWMLCPRCELNYIKKADQYCNVCKKEMYANRELAQNFFAVFLHYDILHFFVIVKVLDLKD